jgi:hypothetical protein
MSNNKWYKKHVFFMNELKRQKKDNELIKDIHIQKQNVITRARLDADNLIENRIKKGKMISDEEKDKIRKHNENDFLEIFELFEKPIVINQDSKNNNINIGNFQTLKMI